ncbi:MAG TPA: DUF3618 domain-containing protein [Solirubrobacteraceae bacterium]|jgi:hypothetical protein|nr:DUF3618 domain-containing protein [Solirubrobacteraceae bacterium]
MAEDTRTSGAAVSESPDPQQIRHEIEDTRGQLGETVAALVEKTDVKAQAKRKAEQTKASISEKKEALLASVDRPSPQTAVSATGRLSAKARENPMPVVAVCAFAIGLLVGATANSKR